MLLTGNTQCLLRIEAKLDALLGHLNIDFDPDQPVERLAKAGDKIAAIRLHRSFHGSSLADAKSQVEAMF
jgi:hypothetical protein